MHSLLKSLSGVRMLVVGDIMLDHYIWGDVYRISPEAPVPVVNVLRDSYTAGGAANVALNLSGLGVEVSLLGYFSADEAGRRLQQIMESNHVNLIKPLCIQQPPTIIKTRVIIRNQQLCRIDREADKEAYRPQDSEGSKRMLDDLTRSVDAVIVSDYAKGVITQPLLDHLLSLSKNRNDLLISIDPKPSNQLSFNQVGLITPNRTEALELAGLPNHYLNEQYPLEEVCLRIHERYSPKLLVITLGAGGMVISKEGKIIKHLPTQAREVFDVSGAGDTVIAVLAAALAAGGTAEDAAALANMAAGCVVAHMGTVPVNYQELSDKLG